MVISPHPPNRHHQERARTMVLTSAVPLSDVLP